jgi:uncharacterized protein YjeT (DUF2065 family)
MLEATAGIPETSLRLGGAFAVAVGVILIWLIRG